jgi:alpha-L-fucosidase
MITGLVLCALIGSAAAGDDLPTPSAASPVHAKADQGPTREQRIQWWREARFGMFIHWGLYSIPAGVWKEHVHSTGYSEWIMFGEKIPAKEYELLASRFKPVKFDANAWVAIAKKAGMKYIVLTTKHHDGFSMFKSRWTPYNIVDATPLKRDVTGELADACREAGLRFGCYYSIDRDWYRPLGPGNRYRQCNVWDYPSSKKEDFDKYFAEFAKPQVEELLIKYRPDILWFDGIDMMSEAQVEALYRSIRNLRPQCLVNSRIKDCGFPTQIPPRFCDYISSGDNEIAEKAPGFEWENPGTMNTSYGYCRNDHQWVDAREIICRLVEIASKGGNYLLNVGPTAEGLIPEPSIQRLAEVGKWMKVNGEAIYGTTAGPFSKSPAWGRVTQQSGKLYLHVFHWPKDGKLAVPGLTAKIKTAYLLADANHAALKTTAIAGGAEVAVPAQVPDTVASVLVLEIEGKP